MNGWKLVLLTCGLLGLLPGLAVASSASSYGSNSVLERDHPVAGYDGGFFLQSKDESFRLDIYSRLQTQYIYHKFTGKMAPGLVRDDINTFAMRRARVVFLGKMYDKFGFTILINRGATSKNPGTTYWYAATTYTPLPEFNLTVGAVDLPLNWGGSSGKGMFTDAPIVLTQRDGLENITLTRLPFGAPTTLGVAVNGTVGRFHYYAAVGNGEDNGVTNSTRLFAYGARVAVDLLGELEQDGDESDFAYHETPVLSMGLGANYEPQDTTEELTADKTNKVAPIRVTTNWFFESAADLRLKWRGVSLITEGFFRRSHRSSLGSTSAVTFSHDDVGVLAQLGVFAIPKKLEFAGRYSAVYREGPQNDAWEAAAGVNWYIHGQNIRFQVDYTLLNDYDDSATPDPARSHRVRSMLTFQI